MSDTQKLARFVLRAIWLGIGLAIGIPTLVIIGLTFAIWNMEHKACESRPEIQQTKLCKNWMHGY